MRWQRWILAFAGMTAAAKLRAKIAAVAVAAGGLPKRGNSDGNGGGVLPAVKIRV